MSTPIRIIGLRPIRLRLLGPLRAWLRARHARKRLAQLRRSSAVVRDIGLTTHPEPRDLPRPPERW